MATKSYQARIVNALPMLMSALKRTHHVYNECLCQMVKRYIDMRKGKYGEDCRELANFMLSRSNTFAHGVMDGLSRPEWNTKLTDEWVQLVKKVRNEHGLLFEQHKGFARVGDYTIHTKGHGKVQPTPGRLAVTAKFWHHVCDNASAYLKSYNELLANWRSDRESWLKDKKVWTTENPEFMKFWNGYYREFEQACERARVDSQAAAGQEPTGTKKESRERGKRIGRWHLWYEWIISHPEIVVWRDEAKASDFVPIPVEIQNKIKRKFPRQNKYIPKFLDWLKEHNPELLALDDKRRFFLRNYLRFKRPPTLTLPSADKHPYWFTFERDEDYIQVNFVSGTIWLRLINEDDNGIWSFDWCVVQFRCDSRLRPSVRTRLFAREGRCPPYLTEKPGNKLNSPAKSAKYRRAGFTGAKLILRKGKIPELVFTVIEQDSTSLIKWQKTEKRTCPADNAFSWEGERISLRVLAIDLGIRHIGGYALTEGKVENGTWIVNWDKKGIINNPYIPLLGKIRGHDRQLRIDRRKRGKAVSSERSCVELQDHRTSMADDRFKKGANLIVEMARQNHVHLILFENLSSLKPKAFDERWMNRQLRDMNRRQIVEMVKLQAREFGIVCKDNLSPWLTSRICSRCFRPGWRFSMKKKEPRKEIRARKNCQEYGYPVWDLGGHLFHCPHCGHKINADINAAGNLIAKFFGAFPAKKDLHVKDGVYSWKENDQKRTYSPKETFVQWAEGVKRRKTLGDTPF